MPERAHAIREAVGHMQRHVRAMLHRLRPASPVEGGLAPALDNLVAFWRARQPTIDIHSMSRSTRTGSAIRPWQQSTVWCRKG